MASDMKAIYRAGSVEEAADQLDEFERNWGGSHPSVVCSWRANWEEIIPVFGFAPEVRQLLYTTNAVENLHRGMRKAVKTRGISPATRPLPSCCTWPSGTLRGSGRQPLSSGVGR